jgi:hypothetical protein
MAGAESDAMTVAESRPRQSGVAVVGFGLLV